MSIFDDDHIVDPLEAQVEKDKKKTVRKHYTIKKHIYDEAYKNLYDEQVANGLAPHEVRVNMSEHIANLLKEYNRKIEKKRGRS